MRKKLLWATVLMLFLVNLTIAPSANSTAPTNVFIAPPIIWDLSMVPGTQFTVNVEVDDVTNLWAYQVELGEALFGIPGFNPNVLNLVAIDNGDFLGSRRGHVVWFPGDIDNTQGTLSLSGAALDPKRRFPSGGGVLMTLTFQVVGYGTSPIHFGADTGLIDSEDNWIIRGTITPEAIHDGFFSNVQGPELYIRTKGAHGGGVWPEWQVNLVGVSQTLYSRVTNHGNQSAWVKVKFTVVSAAFGTQEYWSNEASIDEFIGGIGPGVAVVSATFTPPGPARYDVSGMLYFKVEGMSDYVPYQMVIDGGGQGEATTRDVAEHYKVVTQL